MRVLLIVSLLLAGGVHAEPLDPWENVNRKTHAFNEALDRHVLRPVAVGYDRVMPEWGKTGASNFFSNLGEVSNFANALLQGKPDAAATALGRFIFNSTVGLGGTLDVMAGFGLTEQPEDFGQTLASWGWADSRYLVLPIFGPATLRDGVSRFSVDAATDPLNYVTPTSDATAGRVVDLVNTRASLLGMDDFGGADTYLVLRSVYLERRAFLINDGQRADQNEFLDGF